MSITKIAIKVAVLVTAYSVGPPNMSQHRA